MFFFYFIGNKYLNSFTNLKFYYKYKAENGLNGKSNNKTGKSGKNLMIYVPRGTIVYDNERNIYICEILEHKEKFLIVSINQIKNRELSS